MMCKHMEFDANVVVARLEDTGKFIAQFRINCRECGVPMQFRGLTAGIHLDGACVSVDGLEARIAIVPQGTVPSTLDLIGYSIRANTGPLDS